MGHSRLFDHALLLPQKIMPGGVSSPVRAFKSVGGGPVVFDRVEVRAVFCLLYRVQMRI
jgi:glutamate-1-semialdehyde aminotransferase